MWTKTETEAAAAILRDLEAGGTEASQFQQVLSQAIIKQAPSIRTVNEVAEGIARSRAGLLIKGLDDDQRVAVQRIVSRGIRMGLDDEELRKRLANKVGLGPRYADAVENFRQGLLAQGQPPGVVRKQADAYAKRLRSQRAMTIARYEVAKALNDANRMLWQQMQEDGEASRWAVRVWNLHKDERLCPTCRHMNGRRASLKKGAGYEVPGIGFSPGPPVHPNCRCFETFKDEGIVKAQDYTDLWGPEPDQSLTTGLV